MYTINQKHVKHIYSEYLPGEITSDVIPNYDDNTEYDEIFDNKTKYLNDPIKIDTLRKYLDELESLGANYVSILYHTDHNEYELDGVEVRLATEEEIKIEKDKEKQFQIDFINKELERFKKDTEAYLSKLKELEG